MLFVFVALISVLAHLVAKKINSLVIHPGYSLNKSSPHLPLLFASVNQFFFNFVISYLLILVLCIQL